MIVSNRVIKKILHDCRPEKAVRQTGTADTILLAFPINEQHQSIAYRVFAPVLKSAELKTCCLIKGKSRDLLDDARSNEVIELTLPENLQRQPLLSEGIRQRLQRHRYILALDLNVEFHPYTAAAVLKSGAVKRIGFRTDVSDNFFNIQISKKSDDPIESSYRYMLQLLEDSGLT